jgi:hypothetical protein
MAQLFFLSGRAWTDANGAPYPAAVAHFYVPGTTTDQDTYTTAALSVANSNPVTSDASTGIFGAIYLAALRYKVVIKDASGNTLQTWEVVDAQSLLVASATAPSPTFPFLRWHKTADSHVYRRSAADDAWIDEGLVDSLLNAASVTEQLSGTATDKSATPDSVAGLWQRGDNLTPSGGTVTLPAGGGGVFNVAAGNFSAISTASGGRGLLFVFGGASTITYNSTSMILPGSANITTAAGDCALFVNEAATDASGTNWRCVWFQRRSGSPVNLTDNLATEAEMETNTSTTKTPSVATVRHDPGVAKCWGYFDYAGGTNASHNITSIADTATGRVTVTIATNFSSANWAASVTLEQTAGLCPSYVSKAAGTIEIRSSNGNSGALQDATAIDFIGFGTQ